jgi:hypothetical protein
LTQKPMDEFGSLILALVNGRATWPPQSAARGVNVAPEDVAWRCRRRCVGMESKGGSAGGINMRAGPCQDYWNYNLPKMTTVWSCGRVGE